ncbi:unnamed protein product [Vicia faba]|uniref:C-JID domain-containing protein n=1 Tax=Vicia faba TaxID=3906 RepID=A0AAV1B4B5_VICFA|nr:unnamed protein product [Vicia faba]
MLIFNCPKLGENERYSNMILSWTTHFIQAKSFRQVDIVIPGREIPKWFNNRKKGRSIRTLCMTNIIGIACCAIFSVEPFERGPVTRFLSSKDNTLWELDHIKMEASTTNGQGLLLEVKSCGYRWVFKQDQQSFGSHNNDELQKEESHKLGPATVLAIKEEARP